MSRLKFNSRGELIGVDGKIEDFSKDKESRKSEGLMTSASLEFLKESNFKPIFDKKFWSLYENNYMEKKYLVKPNGKKMKIAMITGRENHDSVIIPGVSCAHPFLPDTI